MIETDWLSTVIEIAKESPEIAAGMVGGVLLLWFAMLYYWRSGASTETEPREKRDKKKRRKRKTRMAARLADEDVCTGCRQSFPYDEILTCTGCRDDFCQDCGDQHVAYGCVS